jgi:hypothetical protein
MRILSFVTVAIVICLGITCYPQPSDIVMTVLEKNQVNKAFFFDSSSKKDGLNNISITYLGTVNTNNKEFKIVTWKKIWGPNQHTIGVVYVYDINNKYVGKYPLGSGFDLPKRIENNNLIFTNQDKSDCDINLTTTINFSKELPSKIFLKCKGEQGDIYSFSTEKD